MVTGGPIRRSPSGDFLEGTVTGQVPVWNQATRDWDPTLPAPPSTISPLVAYWFVDPQTVGTSPNGSSLNPWPTIETALTAAGLAGITSLTLQLCPGTLAPVVSQATVAELNIIGAGRAQSQFTTFDWHPAAAGGSVLKLSACTCAGALTIVDVAGVNASSFDDVLLASIAGTALTVDFFARLSHCQAGQVGGNSARLYSCDLWGVLNLADSLLAWDTHFLDFNGTIVNGVELTGCDLDGGTLTCASYRASACKGGLALLTSDSVIIDGSSLRNMLGGGGAFVSAFPVVVTEFPQVADIAVAVPVLAAGVLGYVDVSTVGTNLAGLAQDTPIGWAPKADVEAAGAATGGPIYARVSAANTIRLAFVGGTTAHAVDFRFWRS